MYNPVGNRIFLSYIVVFFAAGALYVVSCAPGALWQDSGMFQYRVWHNDIEGELGLALAHPLYHIIGVVFKHIPIGEFAYRVNLISVLAAAAAVANLFLLLRLWLGRNLPAVVAAITLGLSWAHWQHACIAEVYTLHSALFLAELVVLLQYCRGGRIGYLYALGLLNGLAVANHLWASLAFVCYVFFVGGLLLQKKIRFGHFGIIVAFWIAGALPYEYLIVRDIVRNGDLAGTLASAVFGRGYQHQVLNTAITLKIVKENMMFLGLNFPTPNVLLFFGGLYAIYKTAPSRAFAHVLLGLLVLFFVFAFRYTVPDRYAFFMPFYCMASVLIGLGAHFLMTKRRSRVFVVLMLIFALLPVGVYAEAPSLAKKLQVNIGTKRKIPYRDEYKWFLQPWKSGYDGPERFARETFAVMADDAIIYADNTTVYALLYAQEVQKQGTTVGVVSDFVGSKGAPRFDETTITDLLSDRGVYVVSPAVGYCPSFLLEQYEFEPAGSVWRVVQK